MNKIEIKKMLRDMSDSQLLKMVLQDRKKYNNKTLSAAIEILHERNVDIEYDKYRTKKNRIMVRVKDNKKDEEESKDEIISKQEEISQEESVLKKEKSKNDDESLSGEEKSSEEKSSEEEIIQKKQEIAIEKDDFDLESKKEEPKVESELTEMKEEQQKEDLKNERVDHIDIEKKEKLNVKQRLKIKEDVLTEENEAEIESTDQKRESIFTRIKQKAKNMGDSIFVFWHYFKLGFLSLFLAILLAAVVFFSIMAFFEFGTSYVLVFLSALLFVILLILIMYRIFALLNGINRNYTGINKMLENFTEDDLEKLKDIN